MIKPNHSIPQATVVPVLMYPDVRKAVDWLCEAFGFVERLRIGENHRSQLTIGDGAVIIGVYGLVMINTRPAQERSLTR